MEHPSTADTHSCRRSATASTEGENVSTAMTASVERAPHPEPAAVTDPSRAERSPLSWRCWALPVAMPIALIALILTADAIESPKTAYVGVLAVVPMLAAVFGSARQTALVGVVAWLSAFTFGMLASDGNVMAQQVRLVIIALSCVGAVFAAQHRVRREAALAEAERSRALVEQMQHDATTDLLTGALNRRGLLAAIEAHEHSTPVTIAIADCDNFKQVNDSLGHLMGDEYLKAAAHRLSRAVGQQDVMGRWGGDEFLIMLPLPLAEANRVLTRIREQVMGEPLPASPWVMLSLSFGAAQWYPGEPLDSALLRADQAMYEGKHTGQGVTLG